MLGDVCLELGKTICPRGIIYGPAEYDKLDVVMLPSPALEPSLIRERRGRDVPLVRHVLCLAS